jgi:hypothetical protein
MFTLVNLNVPIVNALPASPIASIAEAHGPIALVEISSAVKAGYSLLCTVFAEWVVNIREPINRFIRVMELVAQ